MAENDSIREALIEAIRVPVRWAAGGAPEGYLLDEIDAGLAADAVLANFNLTARASMDERTIAEHHATREAGTGCPGTDGGPHYFAYIDDSVDHRICIDCGTPEVSTQEGTKMSNALDREMAKLAALGITVSTKLANPNRDTPMRRIGEAAEHAGIAYDPDAYCVICHRRGHLNDECPDSASVVGSTPEPVVDILTFEAAIERYEKQMAAALPSILDELTLDLFDRFAPDQDPSDPEIDAYRTAAANVVGNLKRLITQDEAVVRIAREAVAAMKAGRKSIRNSSEDSK